MKINPNAQEKYPVSNLLKLSTATPGVLIVSIISTNQSKSSISSGGQNNITTAEVAKI